jgi:hypothetical protein
VQTKDEEVSVVEPVRDRSTELNYPIYYLREFGGVRPQLWKVEEGLTWGLTPLHTAKGIPTTPDYQIWDVHAQSGWHREQFVEPILPPGRFYRRMARPSAFGEPFGCPINEEDDLYISEALGQLEVFCRDLQNICRTIHPVPENLQTFGHEIRNLLILSCTEVEAHWKGVLRLNGRKANSTKQYHALHEPLKLCDYQIRFSRYHWLGPFSPFQGWPNFESPTASLSWYSAYNGVKHDREREFRRASLEQVFNAVAACAVMLVAQFGWRGLGYIDEMQKGMLSEFTFIEMPKWTAAEQYIDYLGDDISEDQAVPYHWAPNA